MVKKSNSGKKQNLFLLFIVMGIVLFVVIFFSVINEVNGVGEENIPCVVTVPDGAGTNSIAPLLAENNIIDKPFLFKLYAKILGTPIYQKGPHSLNPSMGYKEIIKKLTGPPDASNEKVKRISIPEGYEMWKIFQLLSENGLGDYQTFVNEANYGKFNYSFVDQIPRSENRLEGYLFPATYIFSTDKTEHEIIDEMLLSFAEKVIPIYNDAKSAYYLDEIITMASIIEREAASVEELSVVSSVFYNRLKADMNLESCATVQYILQERKKILSNSDVAIDSPYNTYMHKGLPIGPISSPGLAAINAALYPDNTDYLYFVSTADGAKNIFSSTYDEHMQKNQEIHGIQTP